MRGENRSSQGKISQSREEDQDTRNAGRRLSQSIPLLHLIVFFFFYIYFHSGMQFATKDQDNDRYTTGSCAVFYKGAWWYNNCHESNLNGLYLGGPNLRIAHGIIWRSFRDPFYSLKRSEMKLRPH